MENETHKTNEAVFGKGFSKKLRGSSNLLTPTTTNSLHLMLIFHYG